MTAQMHAEPHTDTLRVDTLVIRHRACTEGRDWAIGALPPALSFYYCIYSIYKGTLDTCPPKMCKPLERKSIYYRKMLKRLAPQPSPGRWFPHPPAWTHRSQGLPGT